MKIRIYGGTFDHIHRGHMAAAQTAAKLLELDKLLLIPAGIPPHKHKSSGGANGTQRMEMTSIAADRLDLKIPVEVLDLELKRRLPETFREFRPYLGQCRFLDCSHTKEKGCAVLAALKAGEIQPSRHKSYLRLYEELKPLREWQKK